MTLNILALLAGIRAAVVGVIVNLAVFFAYHVLWLDGFEAEFEWLSLWSESQHLLHCSNIKPVSFLSLMLVRLLGWAIHPLAFIKNSGSHFLH